MQGQLANDLAAVVKAIKAQPRFGRLGLIGHSEGAMIAATVAARQLAAVDFLVSLGGVGLPGLEQMLLQDRLLARDNGALPASPASSSRSQAQAQTQAQVQHCRQSANPFARRMRQSLHLQ